MGVNTNVGQQTSLAVYGNPDSFNKLINNHGQLAKIKQSLACPCVGKNHGSPDMYCDVCGGDGYVYIYQRDFFVSDENSNTCDNKVFPYWQPIRSVKSVQTITSDIQGGAVNYTVESFDDTSITLTESPCPHVKKRVSYYFDGWTYVEKEKLVVDAANKLLYAEGTRYDAGQQSSNPLDAFADIAEVVRIWNDETGEELNQYEYNGKTISTNQSISDPDNMYIEYYYADLTKVINTEQENKNDSETFTHDLQSGMCKMAFYPYIELTRGDIITLPSTVLYKNEQIRVGNKGIDRLWEMEPYSLNNIIFDDDGNKYYENTDYILQGRYIKWISENKPSYNKTISVRYGYKPSYIVFEDNPVPNNLENKRYPITVVAKSWSKISKDDVKKLMSV